MTTQTITPPTTHTKPEEQVAETAPQASMAPLLTLLQQLPPERLPEVQTFVDFLLYQEQQEPPQQAPAKRTPGLHQGAVFYMADDFDDYLGDDFWFPEDDILLTG